MQALSSLTKFITIQITWKPFLKGLLSGPAACEGLKEDNMFEVILKHPPVCLPILASVVAAKVLLLADLMRVSLLNCSPNGGGTPP